MTPQEEEAKILKSIEDGKKAAQEAAKAPCLCVSCTCTGCHTECYGHCNGCGNPVDTCNSYQTGGKKHVTVQEGMAPAAQGKPAPAFDYSGLDDKTVEYLHIAEREYAQGKVWAERGLRRMADGVAIAHEALCVSIASKCRNGQGIFTKSENSFGAWCESIGISRKSAERLLQVSTLYDKSTPQQQKVLEELSPSLLYAAARPSAPAELVEQVKSGDITSHKQYQELLAEMKAKDAALAEKEDALQRKNADLKDLAETIIEQKTARETLEALRDQLLDEAEQANKKYEKAFAAAHQYHMEKEGAEARLNEMLDREGVYLTRIAELESRPIEATAATEEEIDRWRREGAAEEAKTTTETIKNLCTERDAANKAAEKAAASAQKAEEKAEKAQREAKRLRETLQGRTDHLEAVEAELKALKQKIAGAQNALPRLPDPHTTPVPASVQAPPALVLCKQCVYEPICCGIQFLGEDDMSEEMYAGFCELDEDAFDARLVGCTAGQPKESR